MIENIIKEKRIEKGITLNQMCNLMNLSLRHYVRIENGENKLYRISKLNRLCEILDIELIDLFSYLNAKEEKGVNL